MLRNKISRIAALFSVMCIMIISYIFPVSAEVDTTNSSDNNIPDGAATVSSYDYKYSDYLKDNGEIVNHEKKIAIDFAAAALGHDALIGDFNGKNSVIRLESAGAGVSFKAAVKETGYYCLFIDYAGIKENDKKIIFSVSIDGKYPFFEANSIEVSRSYKNATDDFEIDDQGNELRPKQEQVEEWQVTPLYRADGGSCYPYYFFFTAGSHTIDINAVNGGVMLSKIELKQPEKIVSYEEYLKANTADKTVKDGLILQGEKASLKSSASLYPLTDRTSCATQPFSEKNTVLNSIGGTNWSNPGSWIEWEFDIETEGYYQIDMRVLQNGNKGIKSYRTITINGEIPFAEMEQYGFEYNRSWYIETLSDEKTGDPFKFYFKPGHYTLRMEATTGELRQTISSVNDIMSEVNSLYHSIIMVTSTNPDIYRDYNLQKAIPGIEDTLLDLADRLDEQFASLQKISNGSAASAAVINTLSDQMRNMKELPKTISDRVSNFYSNISAVYAWLNSASNQSLKIDAISLGVQNEKKLIANANLFRSIASTVKSFIYSFTIDYDTAGSIDKSGRNITVWMSKGRDQSEILNQLIERTFTKDTGIQVSLKLVQGGVVEAVVAGTGPDVILNQGMYTPVDYAARKVLVPLDTMEGFDEIVEDNFYPNVMIPYEFRGHYYALPETQDFSMMFYRKDILENLGISLPNTWDELKEVMSVLARNNMQIGVQCLNTTAGGAISTEFPKNLLTMLMQNGLDLYNEDLTQTNLQNTELISAFESFSELYTKWGLPYYFDAANRFRTGEMPIMIASISTYNTLAISAPEIAGRWSMDLIPGTVQKDGSINRTVEFNTTSTMMFKSAKDKDAAWEFICWWMSSDTQYEYSMEIESLLGTAGRNLTANYKAFRKIPWDSDISNNIENQWKMASTVPMVPGYYSVSRYLTNALSDSIIKKQNAHVVIEKYANIINNELARKRKQIDALNN